MSRRYASEAAVDRAVAARLERDGVEWHAHSGSLLFDPDDVRTRAGDAFREFTPLWHACNALGRRVAPARMPEPLALAHADVASDSLEDWRLTPQPPQPGWSDGLARRCRMRTCTRRGKRPRPRAARQASSSA